MHKINENSNILWSIFGRQIRVVRNNSVVRKNSRFSSDHFGEGVAVISAAGVWQLLCCSMLSRWWWTALVHRITPLHIDAIIAVGFLKSQDRISNKCTLIPGIVWYNASRPFYSGLRRRYEGSLSLWCHREISAYARISSTCPLADPGFQHRCIDQCTAPSSGSGYRGRRYGPSPASGRNGRGANHWNFFFHNKLETIFLLPLLMFYWVEPGLYWAKHFSFDQILGKFQQFVFEQTAYYVCMILPFFSRW